ncbi:MAG TPA: hypothetical protein VHO67_06490 [Polyangia bacterium]|nr:hypothetical protein [Polyangia bacterium]
MALWFLVAAFAALMIGRAHAEELRPGTAPALTAPAAAPRAVNPPAPVATRAPATALAPASAAPGSVTATAPTSAAVPSGNAAPAAGSPAGTPTGTPAAAVGGAPVLASMSQPSPSTPDGALAVDAAAKTFRGQVILSDVMIAPAAAFTSGDAMVGALQRLKRSTVHGVDGFWRLHMIAFPSPAQAGVTYRLRATDTADGKQSKPIRVFEISAQPGHPEVEMPDLVLTDVMGFKSGHSYEIAVVGTGGADSGAGKEDVYAQGVITLM